MFIRVKEWTVNTNQITFIYHHSDGALEIYFVNEKRMDIEARHAPAFLDELAKSDQAARKSNRDAAKSKTG